MNIYITELHDNLFNILQTCIAKRAALPRWAPITVEFSSLVTGIWHETLLQEEGKITEVTCSQFGYMFIYPFSLILRCTSALHSDFYAVNLYSLTSRLECWQSSAACSKQPLAIYKSYFSSEMSPPFCFVACVLYIQWHSWNPFCVSGAHSLCLNYYLLSFWEKEGEIYQTWESKRSVQERESVFFPYYFL